MSGLELSGTILKGNCLLRCGKFFISAELFSFCAECIGEYQPGKPGCVWTEQEIDIVRQKVLEMIDMSNYVPKSSSNILTGKARKGARRPTENKLLRLTFHDCLKYEVS